MIPFKALSPTDVLFTHFDDATGVQTTYNVTKLLEYCEGRQFYHIPITAEFAAFILTNRGIEQPRLDRLREVPFEKIEPMILCTQEDSTVLLVDGCHRYVHMALTLKVDHGPAYVLQLGEWEPFLVEGAPRVDPDRMINGYSGL
jgi:hypothetical protein